MLQFFLLLYHIVFSYTLLVLIYHIIFQNYYCYFDSLFHYILACTTVSIIVSIKHLI